MKTKKIYGLEISDAAHIVKMESKVFTSTTKVYKWLEIEGFTPERAVEPLTTLYFKESRKAKIIVFDLV